MRTSPKFIDESSDHNCIMIDSGTMILLITALTGGICVLCLYSVYGNVIRHETTLHDLRNRVESLQNKQALHMAELKGEIAPDLVGEVEILSGNPESDADDIPENYDINTDAGMDQSSAEPVSSETNAA